LGSVIIYVFCCEHRKHGAQSNVSSITMAREKANIDSASNDQNTQKQL